MRNEGIKWRAGEQKGVELACLIPGISPPSQCPGRHPPSPTQHCPLTALVQARVVVRAARGVAGQDHVAVCCPAHHQALPGDHRGLLLGCLKLKVQLLLLGLAASVCTQHSATGAAG